MYEYTYFYMHILIYIYNTRTYIYIYIFETGKYFAEDINNRMYVYSTFTYTNFCIYIQYTHLYKIHLCETGKYFAEDIDDRVDPLVVVGRNERDKKGRHELNHHWPNCVCNSREHVSGHAKELVM